MGTNPNREKMPNEGMGREMGKDDDEQSQDVNFQESVGLHNGEEPIEACVVLANGQVCPWWDNNSTIPRNICPGG